VRQGRQAVAIFRRQRRLCVLKSFDFALKFSQNQGFRLLALDLAFFTHFLTGKIFPVIFFSDSRKLSRGGVGHFIPSCSSLQCTPPLAVTTPLEQILLLGWRDVGRFWSSSVTISHQRSSAHIATAVPAFLPLPARSRDFRLALFPTGW